MKSNVTIYRQELIDNFDEYRFILDEHTEVRVSRERLAELYRMGCTDPMRVNKDKSVNIPAVWLVGGRVGY